MDTYSKNINVIKYRFPQIYEELLNHQFDRNNLEVEKCKDGNTTVRIKNSDGTQNYLHSRFNPVKEAKVFAVENFGDQQPVNVIFGFGLGYHIIEIRNILGKTGSLFVFDVNIAILNIAIGILDLTETFNDERIHLSISDDIGVLSKQLSKVLTERSAKKLVIHVPSVQTIPDSAKELKFILEDWNIRKAITDDYRARLQKNIDSNIKSIDKNIGELFGKFANIPFLIVSAGPSLANNINLIKNVKNNCIIICVGRALKALINNGTIPHFFVIIDPHDEVCDDLKGLEEMQIPGIFLVTSSRECVNIYKGPKFLAVDNKKLLDQDKQNYLIKPGGSVATTALDIALKMGGDPILFVGQDLAYTDGKHHVSVMEEEDSFVNDVKNMRKVQGIDGKILNTTLGMLSYKKTIENRIKDEKTRTFINCTQGGAKIEGALHMTFEEATGKYFYQKYDFNQVF